MEADLLTVFGASLPERWRAERFVSFRRLLLIVRHLPPSSATGRALGQWPTDWDLLDDIKRVLLVSMKGTPAMHPDRPEAKAAAARQAEQAARIEAKAAAHAVREQERQARLRAREGTP